MKVLHVYKRSLPDSIGGVEKFIDTLCKTTSIYGVKNEVLSLSRNPKNKPIPLEGYNVVQAKENLYIGSTGFSLDAFSKFKTLSNKVDIIHHHYPHPFGDILQIFSLTNKPYIVTYHSDILRQKNLELIYNPLKHYFLRHTKKIVATSPNYFATSEILQKYASKVEIIPIGLSAKDYKFPERKRLNFWKNKFNSRFFLFVGADRYYKGLSVALKAIENTNIKMVIAGTLDTKGELKKYAKLKSISNVTFLGSISLEDKCALLMICYGFVFPSNLRSEAFGIALLEAAFFGRPLISCEIGTGTSFVNIHKKTGLVINPGDPKDLRNAMIKLLRNKELANQMGKNARSRANKIFQAKKKAKSYFNLYSEILEQNTN